MAASARAERAHTRLAAQAKAVQRVPQRCPPASHAPSTPASHPQNTSAPHLPIRFITVSQLPISGRPGLSNATDSATMNAV